MKKLHDINLTSLVKSNPKANKAEIEAAQELLEQASPKKKGYGLGVPYTRPVVGVSSGDDNRVYHVSRTEI